MKLDFFSHLARKSFRTSPDGKRLFLASFWLFSKPYIIPNKQTENRLFARLLWVLRIFSVMFVLVQIFVLFIFIPNLVYLPFGYISNIIICIFLYWLVDWLVFRKELSGLKRAPVSYSLSNFYHDTAMQQSFLALSLNLFVSLGFVIVGLWLVHKNIPGSVGVGWVTITFFSLFSLSSIYLVYLKLAMPKRTKKQ